MNDDPNATRISGSLDEELEMETGGEDKKNNRNLIIGIVAVVVLCCCCSAVVGGYSLYTSGFFNF